MSADPSFADAAGMDLLDFATEDRFLLGVVRTLDGRAHAAAAQTREWLEERNQALFGSQLGGLATDLELREASALLGLLPGVGEGEAAAGAFAKANKTMADIAALLRDLRPSDDGRPCDLTGAGAHLRQIAASIEAMAADASAVVVGSVAEEAEDILQEAKNLARVAKAALELRGELQNITGALAALRESKSSEEAESALGELTSMLAKMLLAMDAALPDAVIVGGEASRLRYDDIRARLHHFADAAKKVSTALALKDVNGSMHFLIGEEDVTADVAAFRQGGSLEGLDARHLRRILRAASSASQAGAAVVAPAADGVRALADVRLRQLNAVVDTVVLPATEIEKATSGPQEPSTLQARQPERQECLPGESPYKCLMNQFDASADLVYAGIMGRSLWALCREKYTAPWAQDDRPQLRHDMEGRLLGDAGDTK